MMVVKGGMKGMRVLLVFASEFGQIRYPSSRQKRAQYIDQGEKGEKQLFDIPCMT